MPHPLHIVMISREADESEVVAALGQIGQAWRPAYDIPHLIYVEGGRSDLIQAVPGVLSCETAETATDLPASFQIVEPQDWRDNE